MGVVLVVLAWLVLLAVSWPLALLALLLAPVVLLVLLVIKVTFALLKAVLLLPARVLGYRG